MSWEFPALDAALATINGRLDALEALPVPVDLSIQVSALQAAVASLDSRLDAIAGAAADPS